MKTVAAKKTAKAGHLQKQIRGADGSKRTAAEITEYSRVALHRLNTRREAVEVKATRWKVNRKRFNRPDRKAPESINTGTAEQRKFSGKRTEPIQLDRLKIFERFEGHAMNDKDENSNENMPNARMNSKGISDL